MLKKNHFSLSQTTGKSFILLWILYILGCGGGGGDGGTTITDKPPEINQVISSVFSDKDTVYQTGQMVRFDIEETSGDGDIVSGTIRITSETTGYDSGIQDLTFGSIFYQWDTTGLEPADDYKVSITLIDKQGNQTTDDSLTVTLSPNLPAINKLVSQTDIKVQSIGIPVRIQRTYLLDSGFNCSLGYGWTHTYLMHVVETGDGMVKVFNADGSGSFFHSNDDGTYTSPAGDFRSLTKKSDGSFQVKEKNGTLYQFMATGRLNTIEDRNGNLTTLAYDENGLLITIDGAVKSRRF